MSKLILSASFVLCTTSTHAAIINDGEPRMSAADMAEQQAGCMSSSPEMKLAKACYNGGMDTSSSIKYIGTVGDDNKLQYCYNALVIPVKAGIRSKMKVLQDTKNGTLRVQNFIVPPGKTMIAAGVEGRCVTAAKIDGVSCGGNQPLAIGYSGTPGDAVSVGSLSLGSTGAKVTAENGDLSSDDIAKTLVADVDKRLEAVSSALISESESVRARGVPSEFLKMKSKAVLDCMAVATAYRNSHKLTQSEPEFDSQRRQIVDAATRIQAGQPATPKASGATPGSSR